MLVIQEFHQEFEKVAYDYNSGANGYGTNVINSRRDSLAISNIQSQPNKLLARNSLSLAKSNVGGSRGFISLMSGGNSTASSSAIKERQALMYQQVLREAASQYVNSGIVDGVIAQMKIKE